MARIFQSYGIEEHRYQPLQSTSPIKKERKSQMEFKKWRRGWDLNPRARFYQATRFRGGLFQPLRHLSASTACRKITRGMRNGQRCAAMPVETALDCRGHFSR